MNKEELARIYGAAMEQIRTSSASHTPKHDFVRIILRKANVEYSALTFQAAWTVVLAYTAGTADAAAAYEGEMK